MNIIDIFPFIRYARYMDLDKTSVYPYYIPYDARFFYVRSGEGCIVADHDKYILSKHDAIFINAGIEYHLETPEKPVSYIGFNFDYIYDHSGLTIPVLPDTKENFDERRIIHKADFEDLQCFNRVSYIRNLKSEENRIHKIKDEYTRRLIFHELNESKIFSEVIIEGARRIKAADLTYSKKSIEAILDFVHENYAKRMTNIEMGNKLGFHPNYMNSLVKLATGMSLHQYIMHIRISNAIDMLDAGKLTIAQIAEKCGFCDIYHFSRCFKNKIGMSPSKYSIN